MKNVLLNHSILILTRNRPQWIEYSLNFYKHYQYKGEIIIADDSSQDFFNKNYKIISSFEKDLKINHFRGSGRNFNSRVKRVAVTRYEAIGKINTDFYSQTGDDDILYTPNINFALEQLELNKNYSNVQGSTLEVFLDNNYQYKRDVLTWWPVCNYSDPLDRITFYAHIGGWPLGGVNRTKNSLDLYEIEKKLGWKPFTRKGEETLSFFDEEITWAFHIFASGKIGRLNKKLLYFRLKTPPRKEEDRIENLQHSSDLQNEFVLGPIKDIIDGNISKCMNENISEIEEIVKFYKSKYNNQEVSYQVKQCLWNMARKYYGAGILKLDLDICKDIKKQKSKINFSGILRKKIVKFFVFLKKIDFYFNLFLWIRDFRKKHIFFSKNLN